MEGLTKQGGCFTSLELVGNLVLLLAKGKGLITV